MNRTLEPSAQAALASDAYARRLTARLTEGSAELPYDITERLRAARVQALARRKRPAAQTSTRTTPAQVLLPAGGGAAMLAGGGDERGSWWRALMTSVPLLALLAGLVFINASQDERQATELAEVDAALLADDLPLSAYADPGFVQYLRVSGSAP